MTEEELARRFVQNPDLMEANGGKLPGRKPTKSKPVNTAPSEHVEQVALIAWANEEANLKRFPGLDLLYAQPNGGFRDWKTAKALKAEGVRAGVPDLFLPIARSGYHGLYIELKAADRTNNTSPEQDAWIERLRGEGFAVFVCYGWIEATAVIEEYYAGNRERHPPV